MDIEDVLKKINIGELKEKFFSIFYGKGKIFLLTMFLLCLVYCGYLSYTFIYNSSWNEDKKQEYINSKSNDDVFFNRSKFEGVISNIEKRKTEYQNSIEVSRDIFGLK